MIVVQPKKELLMTEEFSALVNCLMNYDVENIKDGFNM